LKVVIPSNPYDAKGLLIASIRDEDPVVFLEPKRVYRAARAEVPEGDYAVELGKAAVVRKGNEITVICYGAILHTVLDTVDRLVEEEAVDAEVIDLRTLVPFDIKTVLTSVEKTGRAIIVHEAPKTCGFGAELSATISEKALLNLQSPVARVAGLDTPFPYTLEEDYLPNGGRIRRAIVESLRF
jgi:2-oxoisovalerate dehydrogenase E1 component beta subunit